MSPTGGRRPSGELRARRRRRRGDAAPDAAGGRAELSSRAATLPLAVIVAALLAILLVPLVSTQRTELLRLQLRDVTEPAREAVTEIHLGLAHGEVLLRRHGETGEPALLRAFAAEVGRVRGATASLDALPDRLDVAVGQAFDAQLDTLQSQVERWGRAAEGLVAARAGRVPAVLDSTYRAHQVATLLTAARLDQAISELAREHRTAIERAHRRGSRLTVGLGLVALVGVASAAWLGWRLQRAALAEERRRRELQAVMETRARFTRGLSHDLKNPLGAIDGHAQLLEMEVHGPVTDAQRESLGRIRGAVRSLLTIIADLLELSAAESGNLAIERRDTDVAALVRELVGEHAAAAQAAALALAVEAEGSAAAATDPARVRQIVGNLLSNAVKYTPAGGRVTVRVARLPAPAGERGGRRRGRPPRGPCVRVVVADSGPGIPPAQRDRVFDEFARLHGASAPGAGLGLAVSRRLARMLGGDVWVAAEGPPGATFVLELPEG